MMLPRTILLSILLFLVPALAQAQDTLPAPTGEVLLTVTGDIAATNAEEAALFDLAMLEGLGITTFETTTTWTEGPQVFDGVAVATLMAALGVEDGTLTATAINDYSVEMPVTEMLASDAIIAFRQNGAEMSVRDKGPLWIVYPYDSDPEYRSETTYARSIWQLNRIAVENEG